MFFGGVGGLGATSLVRTPVFELCYVITIGTD